jgi:hypothetical protein
VRKEEGEKGKSISIELYFFRFLRKLAILKFYKKGTKRGGYRCIFDEIDKRKRKMQNKTIQTREKSAVAQKQGF